MPQPMCVKVHLYYPELWAAQGGKCFYCGKDMFTDIPHSTRYAKNRLASVDHFYPRVDGHQRGYNVVLAHAYCNVKKGRVPPTMKQVGEFIALHAKLGNVQHVEI